MAPRNYMECQLCGVMKNKSQFPIKQRRKRRYNILPRCVDCLRKIPLEDLFIRDKGICGICGEKVAFRYVSIDHIVPISKGGTHDWDNVQLAHKYCNWRKSDKVDNT